MKNIVMKKIYYIINDIYHSIYNTYYRTFDMLGRSSRKDLWYFCLLLYFFPFIYTFYLNNIINILLLDGIFTMIFIIGILSLFTLESLFIRRLRDKRFYFWIDGLSYIIIIFEFILYSKTDKIVHFIICLMSLLTPFFICPSKKPKVKNK